MATLKGQTIAASFQDLVKRADTYAQTGTNVEIMDDNAVVKPTGLYLESGATTDNVGIGGVPTVAKLEIHGGAYNTSLLIKGAGSNSGIKFVDSGDTVDGYIYAVTESIGFLDTTATWRFKVDANSRISLSNNDSGTSNTVFGSLAGAALASGGTQNVFIGDNAGNDVTTADNNVAIGYLAFDQATDDCDQNIAIGTRAIGGNIASNDVNNCVAIGHSAMSGVLTTDASGTVGIGQTTLSANTEGQGNVGVGFQALAATIDSDFSTAIGYQALTSQTGTSGEVGNTAVGYQAGDAITTGVGNTIMGWGVLTADDVGNYTTAIGHNAFACQNIASSATTGNTGLGAGVGVYNVTGTNNTYLGYKAGFGASGQSNSNNTGVGKNALFSITTGGTNNVMGSAAADALTTGSGNVMIGHAAGTNTTDVDNTVIIGKDAGIADMTDAADGTIAIGKSALGALTSGARNVAIGYQAMDSLTQGDDNIGIGVDALGSMAATNGNDRNLAIGSYALANAGASSNVAADNIAIGYSAGVQITTGDSNMAIGASAGAAITTGSYNTMVGKAAGTALVNGVSNVAVGFEAFKTANADEEHNVCIGKFAGDVIDGGSANVIIGSTSDPSTAAASNQIVLGYNATGVANNSVTLGNADVTAVYMSSDSGATVHCGGLVIGDDSELTISSGAITVTQGYHNVDTESDASSDDLDTINGGATGEIIILRATDSARTVVVKHQTGNIALDGSADFSLTHAWDRIMLVWHGDVWVQIGGGNNYA